MHHFVAPIGASDDEHESIFEGKGESEFIEGHEGDGSFEEARYDFRNCPNSISDEP